jgi:hypothetical protein
MAMAISMSRLTSLTFVALLEGVLETPFSAWIWMGTLGSEKRAS